MSYLQSFNVDFYGGNYIFRALEIEYKPKSKTSDNKDNTKLSFFWKKKQIYIRGGRGKFYPTQKFQFSCTDIAYQ